MSDAIDTLEIQVESSADDAIKSLKNLETEMSNLGKSLKSVMGDLSNFGFKDTFNKETKEVQAVSKSIADSLIQSWSVADKEIQSKVRTLCKNIAKSFKEIDPDTGEFAIPDSAISNMDKLADLLAKNGAEATGAAEDMQAFYNTVKGISKIYVPKSVKGDLGGDYASMARVMPGLFTTQERLKSSATELDSIYQDLSQQFPNILPPDVSTEADQFRALTNAIKLYQEERNKLTPLDANDVGVQENVIEDVISAVQKMNSALLLMQDEITPTDTKESVFNGLVKDLSSLSKSLENADFNKITELSTVLKSLDTGVTNGIEKTADSIQRLSGSMAMFNNIKTGLFDKLTTSLNKIGKINIRNLTNASGAIRSLAGSLSILQQATPTNGIDIKIDTRNAQKANKEKSQGAAPIDINSTDVENAKETAEILEDVEESAEGAAEAVEDVGNSAEKASGPISEMAKRIQELKKAIAEMESGKTELWDDAVYENAVHELSQLESKLTEYEKTLNNVTTAEKNVETQLGEKISSLFGKLKNDLSSDLSNVFTEIGSKEKGDAILGTFSKIGNAASALKGKFADVSSNFPSSDSIEDRAIGGLDWAKNYLTEIGGLDEKNSEAIKTIENLKKAINGLGPMKLADSFLGISSGIEYACGEFNKVSDAINNFKKKVQEAFSVTNIFKTVLNGIGSVASNFGNGLAKAFSISNLIAPISNTFSRIGNAIKDAFNPSNFVSGLKTLTSGMASLLKLANPLPSVFNSLKNAFNNAGGGMGYAAKEGNLLTRSLSFVVTQAKFLLTYQVLGVALQNVGDAIGVLAQRSSVFNARLSQLIASCKTFGANVAALAVPLVNTFGPALTYIINLLGTAITYINQFLSAFTGKTYTVASAGAYDYAAGLDSATGSAGSAADATDDANDALKEYQKTIMGFDKLNVLNSQPDDSNSGSGGGGGGGGAGAGDMPGFDYSEMEIDPRILEMVEKIKELAATIFDPMKKAWDEKGEAVIESWKNALEAVKQVVVDVGSSFIEVWTNGTGQEFCENILDLVIDVGDAVTAVATAFDEAWVEAGAGTAYIQSIFNELNAVLDLIHSINRSLIEVFSNGTGKEMFSNILAILTNINEGIANLANRFREAWEAGGAGTQIIQNISNILNIILGYAKDVAQAFKDWTESVDFTGLISSLNGITTSLEEGLNNAINALKDGNFRQVGIIVGDGITAVLQSIDDFITWDAVSTGLTGIVSNIANFLNGLFIGVNWRLLGQTFADGINLIIDSAYTFVTTFSWGDFGTAIGTAIDGFIGNIEWGKLATTFYEGIKGIFSTISNAIDAINWDDYASRLATWLSNIDFPQIGANVGTSLSNIFKKLNSFISSSSVKTGVSEIATGLAEFLNSAIANISFINIGSTLANGMNLIIRFAHDFVTTFEWGTFGQKIGLAIQTFLEDIEWEDLGETFSGFVEGMLEMIYEAKDAVNWVQFGENIGTCLGNINWLGILAEIGNMIIQGFIQGIEKKAGELISFIPEFFKTNIIEPVKDFFGIHSPSTVMAEIGEFLIEGLLQGILDAISGVADWINTNVVEPIKTAFSDGWETLKEKTGEAWESIKENVVEPAKELKDKAAEKVSDLVGDAKEKWDDFKEKTSTAWTDVKESITEAAENFKDKASEKISDLTSDAKSNWDTLKSDTDTKWDNIKQSISDSIENAKSTASTKASDLKKNVTDAFETLKTDAGTKWSNIKQSIADSMSNAKTTASTSASNLKTNIETTFSNLKSDASSKWTNIKSSITNAMSNAKTTAGSSASTLKTNITGYFSTLKSDASTKWASIKKSITDSVSNAKSTASSTANTLKSSLTSTFSTILSSAKTSWNNIKSAMVDAIDSAKTKIKTIVDTVKSFFNFTFKWPNVPLPHFSISPSGWKVGDLLKGSIPTLGIKWYAKGAILDGAQIFGAAGNTLLGGGEAGPEAILPLKELWKQMKAIMNNLFQKNMQADELEPALQKIANNIKSAMNTRTTITVSSDTDGISETSLKAVVEKAIEKWKFPDWDKWEIPALDDIVKYLQEIKLPSVEEIKESFATEFEALLDSILDYTPSGSVVEPVDIGTALNEAIGEANNAITAGMNAIEQGYEGIESGFKELIEEVLLERDMRNAARAKSQNGNNNQNQAPTIEVEIRCDSETLYRSLKKGQQIYKDRYKTVELL